MSGYVRAFEDDCRNVLRTLPDNSIDSVVTDPPYALVSIVKRFGNTSIDDDNDTGRRSKSGADGYARLAKGFMGKEWDNGAVAFSVEFWAEVLRVLKPGGHVAAFGGTRSYHRLACAIEDAGFEIRDQLAWCYGSGFPKSHDVSKGIDKAAGAERKVVGIHHRHGGGSETSGSMGGGPLGVDSVLPLTTPATDAARQWDGWGTALKPAWEPICLARKPLSEKTIAANVLRWGTGAINVDGCRVETNDVGARAGGRRPTTHEGYQRPNATMFQDKSDWSLPALGRWPANFCHDGSEEVLDLFPETGISSGGKTRSRFSKDPGWDRPSHANWVNSASQGGFGDSGSAARFFYCAKASKGDRAGSKHPTIKPIKLMQWLCRLVTPPGGVVLDPFAGSGTTGQAAQIENFNAILIEREAEYFTDICLRVGLQV